MTYLTAQQVADELGISVRQSRGLIQARMSHIRIARNEFRVSREELDSFIRKSTKKPIYKS